MKLLEMSLCAALLITAIVIIRALCLHKIPKKTFILLWCIVLLRLLIPFELPASLLPFELPSLDAGIERLTTSDADKIGFAVDPKQWQLQPMENNAKASFPWQAAVYAAGALLCASFFIASHQRFLRKCADSLPLEPDKRPFRTERRVRLRSSDRILQPFTYGIIKPTVILPKSLLSGEKGQQNIVLLHEFMHIRHHDILLKYLLAAALCLHWFNPLVWVMYILANRDIELVCDEAVLRTLGADSRAAYAMALISLEEQKAGFAPLCSGFNKNAIEERIKAIMKTQKLSRMGKLLSVMLVLAILLATATSAIAQSPEKNSLPTADEQQQNMLPATSTDPQTEPETEAVVQAEELQMICPLQDATLTARFAVRIHPVSKQKMIFDHITLSSANDNIFAAADGVVKQAGYDREKGNTLLIEHANGIITAYSHCASFAVEVGDAVKQGDIIGKVGATGMATGACLGFYVLEDGIACDPLDFFEISE
ncbi:MAG: peptidoglycan DD-metalloendopeptidase family protein [Firmicutes bacterium]|nr:peptidoglycan DD-metalloendopeptidase family protein [Bacillota bacterium]